MADELRRAFPELSQLRTEVEATRAKAVAAEAAAAEAGAELDRRRRLGLETADLEREVNGLAAAARGGVEARLDMERRLGDRLADILRRADPEETLRTLSPDLPLVLLPVRLETRFRENQLLVRVFPDTVHVDDHEPELTTSEVAAGRAFWEATWRGGTSGTGAGDAERTAWQVLAGSLGPTRAAWVARQTEPVGGTPPSSPLPSPEPFPDPPQFPAPATKADAWSRPAVASTLPDRWLTLAFAGGREVARGWGNPIPDELQMGPEPGGAPGTGGAGGDGGLPPVTPGLRWLVDPAAAEEAGMLVRVDLPAGLNRIDRLIVLGVCGSLDAAASEARLAALLDAHHFTDGLGFLPRGTPTNNSSEERAGYASRPTPETTFAPERRPPAPGAGRNADRTASALGLDRAVVAALAHAGDADEEESRAMHTVLWAATWGYWFEHLAWTQDDDDAERLVREHFLDAVRPGGPLPTLRVSRQPYGLLPATSFTRWRRHGETEQQAAGVAFLRSLRRYWQVATGAVPVVRAGRSPDQGLLGALAQQPVSRTVRVRTATGENVSRALEVLIGDSELSRQAHLSSVVLAALGVDAWPYLATMVQARDATRLWLPFVARQSGPAGDAEAAAALARLRTATFRVLDDERGDGSTARSVFYLLARQAAVAERVAAGLTATKDRNPALLEAVAKMDVEMAISGTPVERADLTSTSTKLVVGSGTTGPRAVMDLTLQGAGTAAMKVADFVDRNVVNVDVSVLDPMFRRYGDFTAALEVLERTSKERLELLLGEALDACSHRLDAWLTGVATRRLYALRARRPRGVHLGAYGLVEDLERRTARPPAVNAPPGVPAGTVTDPHNAGYVHAPSLAQATTAAVLRSGHLSHAAGDPGAASFAVDLSSDRVRLALNLLDGVRAGQPLGALLGYRLERELHEGHPGLELDEVIDQLRRLAPPPTLTEPPTAGEGLAPRSVCDGLVLQRMGVTAVLAAITLTGGEQAARRNAVRAALERSADAVDAMADLLLAESVHQLAQGNTERAGATLTSLAGGAHPPPEPDVVRTPRRGAAITHRLLVLVPETLSVGGGWRPNGPRARAEPRLAAWAGRMLGRPQQVEIRATVQPSPPAGSNGPPPAPIPVTFRLTELRLGALDMAYEAAGGSGGSVTSLDQRIARHVRRQARAQGEVTVQRDHTSPGAPLSLAGMVELAGAVRAVLGAARPVLPPDLGRPQDQTASPPGAAPGPTPAVEVAELAGRVQDVTRALERAADDLERALDRNESADQLTRHLDTLAGFGLVVSTTPGQGTVETEPSALKSLVAEARDRVAAATAALAGPSGDGTVQRELAAMAAALGNDFRAVPLLGPANGPALREAFAQSEPLLGGDEVTLDDWLVRMAPVRAGAGRLADVRLYVDALGHGDPFDLRVAQLPLDAFLAPDGSPGGRRWVGLPFTPPDSLGPEPVTSLVAHTVPRLDPTRSMAGVVVDEWVETVPSAEVTTGVAFHADGPGARAPQSILLAVSPDPSQPWSVAVLADVVNETLDLARMRLVDLDHVAWMGRFLPAVYVPDGDLPDVLGLPFRAIVQAGFKLMQADG